MATWQTRPIGEVFRVVNGGTPKTDVSDYWGGPHRWITPAEMGRLANPYLSESVRTLTDEGLRVGAELVPAHSIIFSSRAPIGYLVINEVPMAFNQGCKGLVPSAGIDTKFAFYFLWASVPLLESMGTGTTFKELSGTKLREVPFRSPPIDEQRRIVAILDEAFEGIATVKANAEKNLQNVREWFGSRLEHLFSASDEPKTRLADLCDIKHGYAFDGAHFSSGGDGQAPILLTPGNFTEDGQLQFSERNTKRYTKLDFPHGFVLNEGDLVVVMTDLSSKMKILGKPAIVDRPQLLHNQRIGRVVGLQSRVTTRYLYFFMRTAGYVNAIKRTATGTMVKHTAPRRILDADLPLPSNERQAEIVAALDESEDQIRRLEANYLRRVEALEALQKSLLQHAFAGAPMAKSADEPLEAME